jgi:molecular chaperone DnaJ
MILIDIDLEEAAFGTTKDIQVDTAVVCTTCNGEGAAPGTSAQTCDMCRGRGEVSQVTRSFLGQVMTSRPCPQCQGFGTVVPTPCPECAGDGRIRARRTLTVKIPAGVDNGTRIQLAGEGEVGPGGGPAGDLYVEISENAHSTFQRRGDDLHCTVTLPMTAAALGTKVPLETLDGTVEIDVRPGTQSGQSIPLHGRGITHLRGGGRGDLIVHVEVQTPNKLDPEQEELLRRLAKLRGEERPSGTFAPGQQGLFSRLKDAFNGRA